MFKNDFQGGPYLEVFAVQGKDPLSKLRISGQTSVKKEFDNDLRSFVLVLEGEPTRTKVTIPKSAKQTLHLTQPYLTFQLYLQSGRQFSLEVSITDLNNNKQRIILSSSNRDISVTSLHAKMPCSMVEQNVWLNLCVDIQDIVSNVFEKSQVAMIDSIVVSANCKLKRVFTLKSKPISDVDIPKQFLLGDGQCRCQILDMNTYFQAGVNIRYGTGNPNRRTAPLGPVKANDNSHIAFGSRYHKDSESKNCDTSIDRSSSNTTRNSKSEQKTTSKSPVQNNRSTVHVSEPIIQKPLESQQRPLFLQPKPPSKSAGKVRKPRVKSADYSKENLNDKLKAIPLSKSADSRNRRKISDTTNDHFQRRGSLLSTNRSDTTDQSFKSNINKELPSPVVKLKKRISRSEIDLEHAEKLISEDRENHFKSRSMNALPKIKSNRRYKDADEVYNSETDSVFDNNKDEDCADILADDDMVEEYLRRRTTSSCLDESSLSSCANSTNSDLFLYSSRPKSVTGQKTNRENEMGKIVEQSSIDNENYIINENITETKTLAGSLSNISSIKDSNPTVANQSIESLLTSENPNVINDLNDADRTFPIQSVSPPLNKKSKEGNTSVTISDSNSSGIEIEGTRNPKSLKVVPKNINNESAKNHNNDVTSDGLTKQNLSAFNHLNSFIMRDSCESDTMSWLHGSDDQAQSEKNENNRTVDPLKLSPKQTLRKQIEDRLGSLIVNNKDGDTDDGFSDCSDDTTSFEPPSKFRNYRYQDEIKSIGETLDLAATIPATPQVGDQARHDSGYPDENNNQPNVQTLKVQQSRNEELLDLLFDPVLNCYYDPVTHKYYELS